MIKTLLVDDDFLVRSYLKSLTVWENEGFVVVGEARDGEEALEVLNHTDVEFMVVDISMPLMDGIELIKRVRELNYDIYIIVLSCHDDFTCVKEAMKYGANEYVLKNSLKESTLTPLLVSVKKEISHITTITATTPEIDENSEFLYFNKALSEGITQFYQCAVVSIMVHVGKESEEHWFNLELEEYFQNYKKKLSKAIDNEIIYLGKGIFCSFLDMSEEHKSSEMSQRLIRTATACYKVCSKEEYGFRIGVSDICMGPKSLRHAFKQSRESVKMGFYIDKQIIYYNPEWKMSEEIPERAKTLLKQSDTILYRLPKGEFLDISRKICDEFEEQQTNERKVIQWLRLLLERMGREEIREEIKTINEVYDVLKLIAEHIIIDNDRMRTDSLKGPVKEAVEFILKNQQTSIGLTEVAEAVGVNSSYLSHIFSQETGIGFATFLLNQRVRCAKGLLRNTNLKVRDVALEAGFNDYNYFAKSFKKVTGVSPIEYRKNK